MEQSLEDAQYQKYEELCRSYALERQINVLEIGSGGEGLLSMRQRIMVAGLRLSPFLVSNLNMYCSALPMKRLTDKITAQLRDYRAIKGKFDKIVSIEMLEAVGHEYYHSFFNNAINCLKKDGLLALQVILSPDNRYESFRKILIGSKSIYFREVFLPSMAIIQKNINQTGGHMQFISFE